LVNLNNVLIHFTAITKTDRFLECHAILAISTQLVCMTNKNGLNMRTLQKNKSERENPPETISLHGENSRLGCIEAVHQ